MSQLSLLAEMQDTQQDFEWYPTTNEIIAAFALHVLSEGRYSSILDVGAGNGKVLKTVADIARAQGKSSYLDLFAIEKSRPLLDTLDAEIGIIGTDFWEQTLVDKKVDVIFSNPPYSEFAQWSEKVIREANAGKVYHPHRKTSGFSPRI
jgi:predicted RNA methylase